LADGVAWLRGERERLGLSMDTFEVVTEGSTEPGGAGVAEVARWAEAGATWWLEADWMLEADDAVEACRRRLRAGPPGP
jgi:hypothetical protein